MIVTDSWANSANRGGAPPLIAADVAGFGLVCARDAAFAETGTVDIIALPQTKTPRTMPGRFATRAGNRYTGRNVGTGGPSASSVAENFNSTFWPIARPSRSHSMMLVIIVGPSSRVT